MVEVLERCMTPRIQGVGGILVRFLKEKNGSGWGVKVHEGLNQERNQGLLNYPSGSSLDTDPRKESEYKQVVSLFYCTNIF